MNYYKIDEIYPWLYIINDPMSVCFYLLVGDERALLFDTGHGVGDIPAALKPVTSKPVTVVLGHGHVDHACGAYQFNEAYLRENDFELCREHTAPKYRDMIIDDLKSRGKKLPEDFDPEAFRAAGTGNLKKLAADTVFDLGGLTAKVVDMTGHTQGSVGLLVLEKQTLFVSDSANEHIWMFLNESTTLAQYAKMLERVSTLDFDTFFTGHSDKPHPKSDFQKYIKVASEASIDKAVPYNFPIELKELNPYIYEDDGAAIVFNEAKLATGH